MSQGQAHPCGVRSSLPGWTWHRTSLESFSEHSLSRGAFVTSWNDLRMLCFVRSWQNLGALVLFGSVRGRGAGLVPAVRDGRWEERRKWRTAELTEKQNAKCVLLTLDYSRSGSVQKTLPCVTRGGALPGALLTPDLCPAGGRTRTCTRPPSAACACGSCRARSA